jgi:Ser/Thr protein kinase RdoA (MazF antagonist)
MLESPAPAITSTEAAAIADRLFGIKGEAVVLGGERDANFMLVAPDAKFSLKVANPSERPGVIEMQQLALMHAANADAALPIPHPIATRDGHLVGSVELEEGVAAVRLLTYLEGAEIPQGFSTRPLRRDIGAWLARLDRALLRFEHPEQDREYLWDLVQVSAIRPLTHHLPDQRFEFVSNWLDRFRDEVEPLLAAAPSQVIHGDVNPWNLLVSSGRPESITGLIDFGDVIRSPRIIDPAIAVAYQCFGQDDPAGVAADLVGAYHQVMTLSEIEIDLVPDLVMARLVQSLTIGAWRAELHPENRDYILADAEPAWQAMLRLDQIGTEAMLRAVVDACEPQ